MARLLGWTRAKLFNRLGHPMSATSLIGGLNWLTRPFRYGRGHIIYRLRNHVDFFNIMLCVESSLEKVGR